MYGSARFPLNFQETRAMESYVLQVIRQELDTFTAQHNADFQAPVDAGSSAGFKALHTNSIAPTVNGINGSRGDSILIDTGNSDGSFFANDYRTITHKTKGSAQVYTGQLFIEEAIEGASLYGEGGIYEAQLYMRRRGAYGAVHESLVQVETNKQSRAVGTVLLMSEANTLASYAGLMSAQWNETGARGRWTASLGPQAPGCVEFIEGDFERGFYFQSPNLARPMIYSKQSGLAFPTYELRGNGTQRWGAGVSVDGELEYLGANTMRFNNHLIIHGQTVFDGTIRNQSAANEFPGATAGAGGAVPATVQGYLLVYDSAGVGRKVPYFAA